MNDIDEKITHSTPKETSYQSSSRQVMQESSIDTKNSFIPSSARDYNKAIIDYDPDMDMDLENAIHDGVFDDELLERYEVYLNDNNIDY